MFQIVFDGKEQQNTTKKWMKEEGWFELLFPVGFEWIDVLFG